MEGRFWQNGEPGERAIENAKVGGTMKLSVLSDWRRRGDEREAACWAWTWASRHSADHRRKVGGSPKRVGCWRTQPIRKSGTDARWGHTAAACVSFLSLATWRGARSLGRHEEQRMGGELEAWEGTRAWETAQRPVPIDATQGKWGPYRQQVCGLFGTSAA